MERSEWEQPLPDVLIIDLGEKAVDSVLDCEKLWDEIESIAEDYPGNLIVFKV